MRTRFLTLLLILFFVSCTKDEDSQSPVGVIQQSKEYVAKEYILDLQDFTDRSGPDSLFSFRNLVLDNILVSGNNSRREITAFNIFRVRDIVLVADGDQTIGYQGIYFRKYNFTINFKDGTPPFRGNAYSPFVGETYTHVPDNNLNVLSSTQPHAIKYTRIAGTKKKLHPFGTYTIDVWNWRRTRLVGSNFIFIEDTPLEPNNKANNFNIPMVF